MRRADRGMASERERNGIADTAVGQPVAFLTADDINIREQTRDRCARLHDVNQPGAPIATGPEVARPTSRSIVADDAEALHTMMEPIEGGRFELTEPIGNDAAPSAERAVEAEAEMHVEAVREQVSAAECFGVGDQILEVESDSRVVRRDDGARADPDDRIDPDAVTNQASKHADMGRAPQSARAQHDGETNRFTRHHPHVCSSSAWNTRPRVSGPIQISIERTTPDPAMQRAIAVGSARPRS